MTYCHYRKDKIKMKQKRLVVYILFLIAVIFKLGRETQGPGLLLLWASDLLFGILMIIPGISIVVYSPEVAKEWYSTFLIFRPIKRKYFKTTPWDELESWEKTKVYVFTCFLFVVGSLTLVSVLIKILAILY